MHKYLPLFVTDPRQKAKLEAVQHGEFSFADQEVTRKLA